MFRMMALTHACSRVFPLINGFVDHTPWNRWRYWNRFEFVKVTQDQISDIFWDTL